MQAVTSHLNQLSDGQSAFVGLDANKTIQCLLFVADNTARVHEPVQRLRLNKLLVCITHARGKTGSLRGFSQDGQQ